MPRIRSLKYLIAAAPLLMVVMFAFTKKEGPLDDLLAKLAKFNKDYPQEKVHLQLDKPYYSVGEDIWLKAYVVNAAQNVPTDHSRILYVDLLDDRDSLRQSLLLPLTNGLANANIHLTDSLLASGTYHLYAHTKWMNNFGSDYFFKKDIKIVNALHGAVTGTLASTTTPNGSGKSVSAEISFKTDEGAAFGKKTINYKMSAMGKTLAESKATTDPDGKLIIAKDLNETYSDATIVINTMATLSGGKMAAQEFTIRPLSATADVQFFPEGGHLVSGLRTKIGFKAIKLDGWGADVSGFITDDSGEHLAEFRSEHAGMGNFALMPVAGKTYIAVVTLADGSTRNVALPKVEASGYVLNVNRIGNDTASVRISASTGLADGREMTVLAQSNGRVQFAARVKMDKASNVSYIPLKKFGTGLTQFTLFAPDMSPVAERLIFVDHNDQLRADIKTDKTTYAKRDKVNINIAVADAFGEPVTGSFSIAVTDEGKVKSKEDDETSILYDLLLTSDIKGYIEQPNYYFNEANPDRQKHLDLLLLTQGWTRFNWTDLRAGKYPVLNYLLEKSPTVSGKITTLNNKPVSNGKVSLFTITGGNSLTIDTVADENGNFAFTGLYFPDSVKVAIKATDAKDRSSVRISLDQDRPIMLTTPSPEILSTAVTLADYLKMTQAQFAELSKYGMMKNVTALKEVSIKTKKSYNADKVVPYSVNPNPGVADRLIKMEQIEKQTDLLNVFYGVAGIFIKDFKIWRQGHTTRLQDHKTKVFAGKWSAQTSLDDAADPETNIRPMLVLLDGTKISQAMIRQIPVESVAAIEVMTSGTNTNMYGEDGFWGVILITSKRGGEGIVNVPPLNVGHAGVKGYAADKQFYAPAYDDPNTPTKMADLRSTIYWAPNVITDANGKANISYFNADGTGTYKVTLEGLDTKGKIARKVYTYKVN